MINSVRMNSLGNINLLDTANKEYFDVTYGQYIEDDVIDIRKDWEPKGIAGIDRDSKNDVQRCLTSAGVDANVVHNSIAEIYRVIGQLENMTSYLKSRVENLEKMVEAKMKR
jgi:hypothetical protein